VQRANYIGVRSERPMSRAATNQRYVNPIQRDALFSGRKHTNIVDGSTQLPYCWRTTERTFVPSQQTKTISVTL
jgi:hypothetical protein